MGGADPVTAVQQVSAEIPAGQELAAQEPHEARQGGPAGPGGDRLLHGPLQQSAHASVRTHHRKSLILKSALCDITSGAF